MGCSSRSKAGLRNGNFLTLPNQIVDDKGTITVPYAGAIRARGRTAQEIQAAIVDALKGRALEPQAVVTVVERRNAMISVLGEVNTSVRYPAKRRAANACWMPSPAPAA